MTRVSGDWLTAAGAQRVFSMLSDAGFQALAVGGCVRNALLGAEVADVDISTDALPETVIALADKAGLKSVPTGIEHGTVTVVADGVGYEITTFRADIETDGRRAVVRFSTDIAQDAVRRDFTMNALYADAGGLVVDPLGGLPDLQARRLRFIEDPDQRIREDYLRILRFFRFFAWYGDPTQGMDAEALAAIAANLDGLARLSRERVGTEIIKLLSAPDPVMAVCVMDQCGVLGHVLTGAVSRGLGPLTEHESTLGLAPNGLRRLVGIGYFDGAALRLSKAQQRQIALYQGLIEGTDPIVTIAYRHGAGVAKEVTALRAALLEQPLPDSDAKDLEFAAASRFPVKARDLMPRFSGPQLGAQLKLLEDQWISSGFTLTKSQLLDVPGKG